MPHRPQPSVSRAVSWTLPVLLALLGLTYATTAAWAVRSVSCPGQFLAGPGSYKYRASELKVTNTTCAAGKRLARQIPAYRVLRPLKVDGFYCTATIEGHPSNGGFQHYTCHRKREVVRWRLEIPSEL